MHCLYNVQSLIQCTEMEFLNDNFSQGLWAKIESSHTRVIVWFSTLTFPFYKMLFMKRLELSCFADFIVKISKGSIEYDFL
jgi:hypothetical protein